MQDVIFPAGATKWGPMTASGAEPQDLELAKIVLPLLIGWQRWISRNVQQVEFDRVLGARHTTSIHFELPDFATATAGEGKAFVPLALLKRQPQIANFTLKDEAGSALSVMTAAHSGAVAASTLEVIDNVVEGGDMLDDLIGKLGAMTYFDGPASPTSREEWLSRLKPDLAHLTKDLGQFFLVLTVITEPNLHRVFELSYTSEFRLVRLRLHQWASRFFGWRPVSFELQLPAVGNASSFHFESHAPAGLNIAEATLVAEDGGRVWEDRIPRNQDEEVKGRRWIHLYLSRISGFATGRVRVDFFRPPAYVGRILGSVAFNATLLVLGAIHYEHVVKRIKGGSVDAGVAVLLVATSLVSAYLARSDEHELTLKALVGLRSIVLISGIATYAAAVTLTVGPSGWGGRLVWIVLASVAGALVLPVGWAFLVSLKAPSRWRR